MPLLLVGTVLRGINGCFGTHGLNLAFSIVIDNRGDLRVAANVCLMRESVYMIKGCTKSVKSQTHLVTLLISGAIPGSSILQFEGSKTKPTHALRQRRTRKRFH